MHVDIAGNVINSIAMECIDGSIERHRFSSGVRYILRSYNDGSEVHVIGKNNMIFIEIWDVNKYAFPLVVLRYKASSMDVLSAAYTACYAHELLQGKISEERMEALI
ncbi:MAG: hypothetical protein RXO22_06170 [Thermocladium sp.]|jgi:hypothetical protein|nr:MAG: hypothetical protein AT710_08960 [Thermocladium sp. ECH_B]